MCSYDSHQRNNRIIEGRKQRLSNGRSMNLFAAKNASLLQSWSNDDPLTKIFMFHSLGNITAGLGRTRLDRICLTAMTSFSRKISNRPVVHNGDVFLTGNSVPENYTGKRILRDCGRKRVVAVHWKAIRLAWRRITTSPLLSLRFCH